LLLVLGRYVFDKKIKGREGLKPLGTQATQSSKNMRKSNWES